MGGNMKKAIALLASIVGFGLWATSTMAEDAFSAIDMANEAQANRMRFDKQFKDMQFDVAGEIFKIDEKNGKYIVYLHGAANKNPMRVVACEFDPKYEDAVMKMDKGNTITAHCVYRGKQQFEMGAFTLVDCEPK